VRDRTFRPERLPHNRGMHSLLHQQLAVEMQRDRQSLGAPRASRREQPRRERRIRLWAREPRWVTETPLPYRLPASARN
jgi:hypothetical protein